jgi:hypothetical protein
VTTRKEGSECTSHKTSEASKQVKMALAIIILINNFEFIFSHIRWPSESVLAVTHLPERLLRVLQQMTRKATTDGHAATAPGTPFLGAWPMHSSRVAISQL